MVPSENNSGGWGGRMHNPEYDPDKNLVDQLCKKVQRVLEGSWLVVSFDAKATTSSDHEPASQAASDR